MSSSSLSDSGGWGGEIAHHRILEFYRHHVPEALPALPRVLASYGCEEGGLQRLWKALQARQELGQQQGSRAGSPSSPLVPSLPSISIDAPPSSTTPPDSDGEARRILREVSKSKARTNASMRRLLRSTIGELGSSVVSATMAPLEDAEDVISDGGDVDDEEEAEAETEGEKDDRGGPPPSSLPPPPPPEDELQSMQAQLESTGAEAGANDMEETPDVEEEEEEAQAEASEAPETFPDEALKSAERAVKEANEVFDEEADSPDAYDDLDTDSSESGGENVGMSTLEQKKHYHALTSCEVNSSNSIRKLLQGAEVVPMTDASFSKLSPRIDLSGSRPLTPREKKDEKRRRRSSVPFVTGVASTASSFAPSERRLSAVLPATSASIRGLLDSIGTVAMTDENGAELSPRLPGRASSADFTTASSPRDNKLRRKSLPAPREGDAPRCLVAEPSREEFVMSKVSTHDDEGDKSTSYSSTHELQQQRSPKIPPLNLMRLSPASEPLNGNGNGACVPVAEKKGEEEERRKRLQEKADEVTKLLQTVGTMKSVKFERPKPQPEQQQQQEQQEAKDETPEPTLEEIQKVLPKEIIEAFSNSACLGTQRYSVKRSSPFAATLCT